MHVKDAMMKRTSRIRVFDYRIRHIIPAKKRFFHHSHCIIIFLLFIGRSIALVLPYNSIPFILRHTQPCRNIESVAALYSAIDDNFDPDVDDVTKGISHSREKDDFSEDETDYIGKIISNALEHKASINDNASKHETENEPSSALTETKRMIEKQQQQIDLLMNLMKQQNQEQSSNLEEISRKSGHESLQPKASTNVAPLKANLFIDGTWLYYSLNTRNPDRCPIIKKFGKGWQNNYKVDWLALPKLICAQMEEQRYSKVSRKNSKSCNATSFSNHSYPFALLP